MGSPFELIESVEGRQGVPPGAITIFGTRRREIKDLVIPDAS